MQPAVSAIRNFRGERRPEDSGEWRPVPIRFKPLPRGRRLRGTLPAVDAARIRAWSQSLPLFQMATAALAAQMVTPYWPDGWRLAGFLSWAVSSGFVPAFLMAAAFGHRRRIQLKEFVKAHVYGQWVWLALGVIPLYGVLFLLFCVLPSTIGIALGAGAGGIVSRSASQWRAP
jgi:hypothetical protein